MGFFPYADNVVIIQESEDDLQISVFQLQVVTKAVLTDSFREKG